MQRRRLQLAIQSMMIAVALVGLNLAGAMATAKLHAGRASPWLFRDIFGQAWEEIRSKEGHGLKSYYLGPDKSSYVFLYKNKMIEIGRGHGTPRQEIKRIVLAPPPSTTLQIWSPLIASLLLTIVVLVVPRGHTGRQRRGIDPTGDSFSLLRQRRLCPVARRLSAVLLLVGLNLVAALYRPAADPYDDRLETPLRSDADLFVKPDGGIQPRPVGGTFLVMKPDGYFGTVRFGGRREATADGTVISYDEHGLRVCYGDDPIRVLGTIVYKPDGSIVGYEGRPGEMRAPPHVIRPPLRSFLEMWSPVMASASISLLVLGILWRQLRRQRADPVTENER